MLVKLSLIVRCIITYELFFQNSPSHVTNIVINLGLYTKLKIRGELTINRESLRVGKVIDRIGLPLFPIYEKVNKKIYIKFINKINIFTMKY